MGSCLGIGGIRNPVDADMLIHIAEAIADALEDFPELFIDEKNEVMWDCFEIRDGEFKDPLFGDVLRYDQLENDDGPFNELALKRAASKSLKDVLDDIVHDLVDEQINSVLAPLPGIAADGARKLANKACDKAVSEAVDKAIKELREDFKKNGDKYKKKFEEGASRVKQESPALGKIKAKKGNSFGMVTLSAKGTQYKSLTNYLFCGIAAGLGLSTLENLLFLCLSTYVTVAENDSLWGLTAERIFIRAPIHCLTGAIQAMGFGARDLILGRFSILQVLVLPIFLQGTFQVVLMLISATGYDDDVVETSSLIWSGCMMVFMAATLWYIHRQMVKNSSAATAVDSAGDYS